MGRDQSAAVARTTVGMQTMSQAEQDLCLAQQGRLPLPKAALEVCKGMTGLLRRATEQARQGYIMEAERDVCMVSLLLALFGNTIYKLCILFLCASAKVSVLLYSQGSASLVGLPSKHVVASIPLFLFRWSVLNLALYVLHRRRLFKEHDISLAHFLGFQSLTCLIPVFLC